MALRVVLVDGVGNGAVHEIAQDCLRIELRRPRLSPSGPRMELLVFAKTKEPPQQEMAIYRLQWNGEPIAPRIRHIAILNEKQKLKARPVEDDGA